MNGFLVHIYITCEWQCLHAFNLLPDPFMRCAMLHILLACIQQQHQHKLHPPGTAWSPALRFQCWWRSRHSVHRCGTDQPFWLEPGIYPYNIRRTTYNMYLQLHLLCIVWNMYIATGRRQECMCKRKACFPIKSGGKESPERTVQFVIATTNYTYISYMFSPYCSCSAHLRHIRYHQPGSQHVVIYSHLADCAVTCAAQGWQAAGADVKQQKQWRSPTLFVHLRGDNSAVKKAGNNPCRFETISGHLAVAHNQIVTQISCLVCSRCLLGVYVCLMLPWIICNAL